MAGNGLTRAQLWRRSSATRRTCWNNSSQTPLPAGEDARRAGEGDAASRATAEIDGCFATHCVRAALNVMQPRPHPAYRPPSPGGRRVSCGSMIVVVVYHCSTSPRAIKRRHDSAATEPVATGRFVGVRARATRSPDRSRTTYLGRTARQTTRRPQVPQTTSRRSVRPRFLL